MAEVEIIDERVAISHGALTLSGILSYPPTTVPQVGILLCPPHPSFAGNMENNVIQALAGGLTAKSVTLRFDYRGIGASEIDLPDSSSVFDYWDALEEAGEYQPAVEDCRAALTCLATMLPEIPLIIVGYSFGAIVGVQLGLTQPCVTAMVGIAPPLTRVSLEEVANTPKPCLLLSGAEDFVYDIEVSQRLGKIGGAQLTQECWTGSDHFFRGEENRLCERLISFCTQQNILSATAKE